MKRPFGVTVIGVLMLAQGVLLIAEVVAALSTWVSPGAGAGTWRAPFVAGLGNLTTGDWLTTAVAGGLGLFITVCGIGMLRMHPWAWLAAMALQGWTLAVLLLDYFARGQSSYATMLLSTIIVFYLNSRTVRRTFEVVRGRETAREATGTQPPSRTSVSARTQTTVPRQHVGMADGTAHELRAKQRS